MGAYLDAPITDKNPEPGENKNYIWGACAMQGWRCGMEDAHICFEPKGDVNEAIVFGVFDGHEAKKLLNSARKTFKKYSRVYPLVKKNVIMQMR